MILTVYSINSNNYLRLRDIDRAVDFGVSCDAADLLVREHSKHPDNQYMFPSPVTGKMYHSDSVVKLHEKILKDAELEHIRFHDLSFATLARQNDMLPIWQTGK